MINEQIICEERKQDLYLGRTRIPNALLVINMTPERVRKIAGLDRFINEIRTNQLPVEQRQLQKSLEEITILRYPQLDLSFLSTMTCELDYEGQKVRLPRFGVYNIDGQDFSINISDTDYMNEEGFRIHIPAPIHALSTIAGSISGSLIGANQGYQITGALVGALLGVLAGSLTLKGLNSRMEDNYKTSILSGTRNLPSAFRDELGKCIELSDYIVPTEKDGLLIHDARKIPSKVREKFCRMGDTTFSSEVGFTVPSKTKEEIKQAAQYFGRQNIYFIAEVKPEDWNATRLIEEDPLVVGLSRGKGYLVDSFNPTALEKVVSGKDCEVNYEFGQFSQN